MINRGPLLILALFTGISTLLGAEADTAIRTVLSDQVAAWNRGDLDAFAGFYAPDCVYVGKNVVHGREKVLENYRRKYSDRAAMGKVNFSNLQVKKIDAHSAIVIGAFHLERSATAGGAASGIFSLVMTELNGSWAILLDHTN